MKSTPSLRMFLKAAKEKGFDDPKEFYQSELKTKTRAVIAREIGISVSIMQYICLKLSITDGGAKTVWAAKKAAWNKKHGTNYETVPEWLAAVQEQVGSAETCRLTGASRSYVCFCATKKRTQKETGKPYKTGSHNTFSDTRPGNVPGPWTNPNKAPCAYPCKFITRDKNQPGCVNCARRHEYLDLNDPEIKTNGELAPSNGHSKFREYNYSW